MTVAKEAGHSRTLIGHNKCRYPNTRDFIVALREDPENPTRMQDVVAKKRVEAVRLSRELKLSQTQNATLLSRILLLERNIERLQRENKRRREAKPVVQLVSIRGNE